MVLSPLPNFLVEEELASAADILKAVQLQDTVPAAKDTQDECKERPVVVVESL